MGDQEIVSLHETPHSLPERAAELLGAPDVSRRQPEPLLDVPHEAGLHHVSPPREAVAVMTGYAWGGYP